MQPGGTQNPGGPSGTGFEISNIAFIGQGGDINGLVGNESSYISGISLGFATGRIHDCAFGGCLWDGIVQQDALTFVHICRNLFDGVYRDAIGFPALNKAGHDGNFTTSTYVYHNKFALFGRYAFLADVEGEGTFLKFMDNVLAGGWNSSGFFAQSINWDWYVGGVPCAVYLNAGGWFQYHGNSGPSGAPFDVGGFLINCEFKDSVIGGLFLMTLSVGTSGAPAAALVTFRQTYGYTDYTNARNFSIGVAGDASAANQAIYINSSLIAADGSGPLIGVCDGQGFSSGQLFIDTDHVVKNFSCISWNSI